MNLHTMAMVPVVVMAQVSASPVALGRVNVGPETYSFRLNNNDGTYTLLGNRREMVAKKAGDGSYTLRVVKGPALRNIALRRLEVKGGRLVTTR